MVRRRVVSDDSNSDDANFSGDDNGDVYEMGSSRPSSVSLESRGRRDDDDNDDNDYNDGSVVSGQSSIKRPASRPAPKKPTSKVIKSRAGSTKSAARPAKGKSTTTASASKPHSALDALNDATRLEVAVQDSAMAAQSDDQDEDACMISGSQRSTTSTRTATSNAVTATATKRPAKAKAVEDIYQKKTQLEHILIRPDTYIGSTEPTRQAMWVWDGDQECMVHREISYVPGFYKIFDEILVNAADNKIRDPAMDTLRVSIDRENNEISVYNNGRGIPVQIHKKENVYVPELIFGHLLTSSNYDDQERKVTGGRNGYGAKLCNIFSTRFIVETADRETGKKFKQIFSNNMSHKTQPQVANNLRKEEYTRITFRPDLAKFGMTGIDPETESLLNKRVYDMAGTVRNVKVYLNDQRIPVNNFRRYIDLYMKGGSSTEVLGANNDKRIIHQTVNDRWEIAFTLSEGQFQQVSFVNSINTSKGGTHVTYIADQICAKVFEAVQKKNKAAPVKAFQIKNYMWVFVNCLVENPTFDSQTKENMTLKVSAFGSKASLEDEFINKVKKSGLIENVLQFAKFKQDQLLRKTDGSKRNRITGISKLDDANNAGSRHASRCTLILTEGDSAKTLAVTGLGVVGRDNYGVFPLRGKLLNVREASHKQIMENAEINSIKQIMGLQHGKKYSDTSSLRYGHLMIMTDQDHDGSHIKGLIINFIDHFWPDLLKVQGFLCEFITPIVKVYRGGDGSRRQEISFYTVPEYETWKEANQQGKGWTIKYYKGLGTSTKEDAKQYFRDITRHEKSFSACREEDRELIDLAFNKKKADDRKDWLRNFRPGTFMDHDVNEISLSDFVNKELVLYSIADNIRSLPCMVDGLKPGLRKIIYSCFKRNLTKGEIKVAQLSGYVAEHSAYHHGEQSLQTSIVGLAQNFVGSNNINLLEPRGQFGSRLQGGKDAASARYIFTRLSPLSRMLFHRDDDALMNYLQDDGQLIEPEWYLPILPLLLVNGGEGIGTGWSSFIPNYNPRDLVDNLKRMMKGESTFPMHPWYRGFKGTITPNGSDRYSISGIWKKTSATTLEITELPVRTWTQSYKEFLETLMSVTEKTPAFIKDYKEYHTDSNVHFVVSMSEESMMKAEAEGIDKKFKLTTTMSTSNMVCFDREGRIRKYGSPEELLQDFYQLRLSFYQKRKEYLADLLTAEWKKLSNKARFIHEIIEGSLRVQKAKKADLMAELKRLGYNPFPRKLVGPASEDRENEEEDDDAASAGDDYEYLLSMPLWNLTVEKYEKLKRERDEQQAKLDILLAKSVRDLWTDDLDRFIEEFESFTKQLEQDELGTKAPPKKSDGKSIKKPTLKVAKAKQRRIIHGEDDDSEDETDSIVDDDSEDEYLEMSKPKPTGRRGDKSMEPAGTKTTKLAEKTGPSTKPFASMTSVKRVLDEESKKRNSEGPPQNVVEAPSMQALAQRNTASKSTTTSTSKTSRMTNLIGGEVNSRPQITASPTKADRKPQPRKLAPSRITLLDEEKDEEMEDAKVTKPRNYASIALLRQQRKLAPKKVQYIEVSSGEDNDEEGGEDQESSSFEISDSDDNYESDE